MRGGWWTDHGELLRRVGDSGVVLNSTLVSFGISSSTVVGRCCPGGPWQRILPGVILLSNGRPTQRQRLVAALAYCGEGAVLTGRAALQEHGFRQDSGIVDVLLPDRRRVQTHSFVRIERTTRRPHPVVHNGLPCAPLPRALLDAARRCTTLDSTRSLIASVVQRKAVTAAELATELEAGSCRGSALPRIVVEEMDAGVHSVPEAVARKIWQASGLPEMVFNRTVLTDKREFLANPDGWIDSVGLAWEIDSVDWHAAPDLYAATIDRRTRMQNAGIVVLATLPRSVHKNPREVVNSLRLHYAAALKRPRPPVVLVPREG